MSNRAAFYQGQLVHLAGIIFLVVLTIWANGWGRPGDTAFLGFSGWGWFIVGLLVVPLLQFFVWVVWRSELYGGSLFGEEHFSSYRAIFLVLLITRIMIVPVALAVADYGSLPIHLHWSLTYIVAPVLALLAAYTGYSVVRYFGITRATGADHFFPAYRDLPLETRGIYGYTNNAMYIYAMLGLYAIAIWGATRAGLAYAAYNHAATWLHYYCTERPDMRYIYGDSTV